MDRIFGMLDLRPSSLAFLLTRDSCPVSLARASCLADDRLARATDPPRARCAKDALSRDQPLGRLGKSLGVVLPFGPEDRQDDSLSGRLEVDVQPRPRGGP